MKSRLSATDKYTCLYLTCWALPPAATGCTCSETGCKSWRSTIVPGRSWSASSTLPTLPRLQLSRWQWSSAPAPPSGYHCVSVQLAPGGSGKVTGSATAGAWSTACCLALCSLLRVPKVKARWGGWYIWMSHTHMEIMELHQCWKSTHKIKQRISDHLSENPYDMCPQTDTVHLNYTHHSLH